MAWVVLSTSSLLDETTHDVKEGQDQLESMVRCSGYSLVNLPNIMRNSSSISLATSPDNVNRYHSGGLTISKSIRTGGCSTVTGSRPTWYTYKYSSEVNYKIIASCVENYLKQRKSDKIAILCDYAVSPKQVKTLLTGDIVLYDAGVEKFAFDYKRHHYDTDIARQEEDLLKWISNGGILLTHEKMFRGCEAETVVYISHFWANYGGVQLRSGVTRAVSNLCIIVADDGIKQDEIKRYFNVINVNVDV